MLCMWWHIKIFLKHCICPRLSSLTKTRYLNDYVLMTASGWFVVIWRKKHSDTTGLFTTTSMCQAMKRFPNDNETWKHSELWAMHLEAQQIASKGEKYSLAISVISAALVIMGRADHKALMNTERHWQWHAQLIAWISWRSWEWCKLYFLPHFPTTAD